MGATDGSDAPGTVRPGTLTALLRELAAAPVPQAEGLDAGLRPGLVVDRFELIRELGRGGFGVVWEAKDRELARRVALKFVRPGDRRDLREERLLGEAEAVARLSHPNVVTLFDVGRSTFGPYLVLELLEGRTLAERLGEDLTVRESVQVAAEVARGLAHAHAHGVVHRDLKPANVFLCRDGRVKVLDLGLAHAFGHRKEAGGTPGYMAPEQEQGAPEDERTDVWALGAMLFEMLSGRRAFDGERALRRPAPALDVPGVAAAGALVQRMLAANPVDRPRDGAEVLAALAAIEQAVATTPAAVHARVRAGRSTRRTGLVLAGAALAGLVVGAGAWWARPARRPAPVAPPPSPVALAVLPLANLSGDDAQEYFSDGMTDEITGKLSRLGGLDVKPRSSVARYKGSRKDAREIGAELGVSFLVEGAVRRAGDRIRVSAALVRTADALQVWSETMDARLDDVFTVQERVATRVVEALRIRLSPDEAGSLQKWGTRNAAAYDEYLRGQALAMRTHFRENLDSARRRFERALEIDAAFAPAIAGLAYVEAAIYRNFEGSPERLARARTLLDRALAIDPTLSRALTTSGLLRAGAFDYRGAAEDFRRFAVVEPRNAEGWDGVCFALGYLTPPDAVEAERACRRSLAIDPGYTQAYYHLARALIPQRRIAEAEQAIDELARLSPEAPFVQSGRFWIHLGANRPRQALAVLRSSRTAFRRSGLFWSWEAMALAQAGDIDGAFSALGGALERGYRDVAQLRGDPYLEPLRRDRRFAALLARYGIALRSSAPARTAGIPDPGSPASAPQ